MKEMWGVLRLLEQERARYAWKCIREVKGDADLEGRYKSCVRRAASYIQVNGLGNTMAFYRSKFEPDLKRGEGGMSTEGKAYKLVYEHLNGWFRKRFKEGRDILEWMTGEDTSSTMVFHAAREIIALLGWMKRFAEAELGDG